MRRLGYERYGAQGGDTGAIVSPELGRIDGDHVVGVHANGLTAFPTGDADELAKLTDSERGGWRASRSGARMDRATPSSRARGRRPSRTRSPTHQSSSWPG